MGMSQATCIRIIPLLLELEEVGCQHQWEQDTWLASRTYTIQWAQQATVVALHIMAPLWII